MSSTNGSRHSVRKAFLIALAAIPLALFWIWLLCHRTYNIPSGAMVPTLLAGDYALVSTSSYGLSKHSPIGNLGVVLGLPEGKIFASPPSRGDVAIFKLPRDG
jgi:signal peptidase I